ncbi:MAG: hypothetical protein DRQ55_05500 [Planctomycetota bacterium]|nr:MAG: hypothetical protein DRQ55_05500 [Planctomycetota bacterium]
MRFLARPNPARSARHRAALLRAAHRSFAIWPALALCLATLMSQPADPLDERKPLVLTPGEGLSWNGLTFEALWSQDLLGNVSGGASTGWSRGRKLDLSIRADLDRAADMPGATAYVSWYATGGGPLSARSGDLQVASNIEGPRRSILAELWFEQRLADDALRLKLGKLDANSEFATTQHGGEFLNSSFGFSPTVFALPSYPDPAYAALAAWRAVQGLQLKAGLFDGSTAAGKDTAATACPACGVRPWSASPWARSS